MTEMQDMAACFFQFLMRLNSKSVFLYNKLLLSEILDFSPLNISCTTHQWKLVGLSFRHSIHGQKIELQVPDLSMFNIHMLCYARFTCDIKNKARNSTISIVMNSRSLYTVYERIQRVNKSGRLLYLDVCVKACYAASLCAMQSLKQCSCTVFCSQVIDTITE